MNLKPILLAARKHDASDIHLLVGLPPMFRIHGEIVASKGAALTREGIEAMMTDSLNAEQRARLERDWQLCFSVVVPECGRARVTVYRRNGSHELSIRMSEQMVRTREELLLPLIIDDLARKPNGLVVITGPTGSGKTTTLHYMLDQINAARAAKIVTIEDPIEYVHAFKRSIVVQQEMLTDAQDFATSLRHVLRQDPDVIAIGEMRDKDSIHTALLAAETGHLVIATLHTPGAIDVVQRLVSAFPGGQQQEVQFLLANVLQGVVAQQLLPRASSKGRIVCCEVLVGTMAVRRHIREGDAHLLMSELQSGRRAGMVTLDHALLDLYQRGEITYDTATSMARAPDSIKVRAA
jgi:twitching motility protein PilT